MITDLTDEQKNQIVVALRFWQETLEDSDAIPPSYDIFFEDSKPLSVDEIEGLIDQIHEWD